MAPALISINERNFPVAPSPGQLRNTYSRLRDTAITLNRSRGNYIGQCERQQKAIAALTQQLADFQNTAALTFAQKAELNRIIDSYAQVFEELEGAGDELIIAVNAWNIRNWRGVAAIPQLLDAVNRFIRSWLKAKESINQAPAIGGNNDNR